MAPKKYYSQHKKNDENAIRRVDSRVPFAPEYKVTDISLHHKGPQEDEYFLAHPELLP